MPKEREENEKEGKREGDGATPRKIKFWNVPSAEGTLLQRKIKA